MSEERKKSRLLKDECFCDRNNHSGRSGIVLLITLVILVVLSVLGYTLTSRVFAHRHRAQYMIDYQAARYGCDSALKYVMTNLADINTPDLIDRPNEPDFSDLFSLSEEEYQQILDDWAELKALEALEVAKDSRDTTEANDADIMALGDILDNNDVNSIDSNDQEIIESSEPNSLTIPGPYGPAWPYIAEPVEIKVGSATVTIEIEDENAKYPLVWALLNDPNVEREAAAGLETFCEWMGFDEEQLDLLKSQLKEVSEKRQFVLEFKTIEKSERKKVGTRVTGRRLGKSNRIDRYETVKTTISVSEQAAKQTAIFAKLFHSSLIDTGALARPTIISESRKESALKYIAIWGSDKVNVNTAPRQVLEATFSFGGDYKEIAEEIIQRRRIKPFANIDDLKKTLFEYSDSIGKCEKYIVMTSTFFTIKITAVSGVARASTVMAITRNGISVERVAVISG